MEATLTRVKMRDTTSHQTYGKLWGPLFERRRDVQGNVHRVQTYGGDVVEVAQDDAARWTKLRIAEPTTEEPRRRTEAEPLFVAPPVDPRDEQIKAMQAEMAELRALVAAGAKGKG